MDSPMLIVFFLSSRKPAMEYLPLAKTLSLGQPYALGTLLLALVYHKVNMFLMNLIIKLVVPFGSYKCGSLHDALDQPKPNVDLANKSPMESKFGLMVHEILNVKTRENSNFLKKGKTVNSVIIQNFSRSRMMKRTSPLESSHEI